MSDCEKSDYWIVCPHCGNEGDPHDARTGDTECENCNNPIHIEVENKTTFTVTPLTPTNTSKNPV